MNGLTVEGLVEIDLAHHINRGLLHGRVRDSKLYYHPEKLHNELESTRKNYQCNHHHLTMIYMCL